MNTTAAISAIYTTYRRELYLFIKGMVHNPEETEDILQECFARIFSYDERHGLHEGNLKSLLFTTARNLSLNYLKRSSLVEYVPADLCPEPVTPTCRTEHSSGINLDRLTRELNAVNRDNAEIFSLRAVKRLSCKEIADLKACSERTVRRKYADALGYIRCHCSPDDILYDDSAR